MYLYSSTGALIQQLGSVPIGAITANGGSSGTKSLNVTLPSNLAAGSYSIGVTVATVPGEVVTGNNSFSTALTIVAPLSGGYTFAQRDALGWTDYYNYNGGNILEVRETSGHLSWGNNNPGNVTYIQGAEGTTWYKLAIGLYPSPNGHTYYIYPDYATGVQAAIALLQTSTYRTQSIDNALQTWTGLAQDKTLPTYAKELVDLHGYQSVVDKALALPGSTPVGTLTQAQLYILVDKGIKIAEGWLAGTSPPVVAGTPGNDVLKGGGVNVNDVISGGAGNDTLFSGLANDTFWSGTGTNSLVFQNGWGHDTMMDWTAGTNILDMTALASVGVHSLANLSQSVVNGSDVISHGTDSLTLVGVNHTLTASSFKFA